MASSPSDEAFRQMHRLFNIGAVGTMSDAELLDRFVSRSDETAEAAFEELLVRHGPMVLRVCRSRLHDAHDAEDAFQAVFLVLANRAGSIRQSGSLGSWLFGVARRVVTRARRSGARRQAFNQLVAERTSERYLPSEIDLDGEILHEEIGRLPERLRAPVVLCYLQGSTYVEAARQLGLSMVAIQGRLARARGRLRQRLLRRGVTVPAGLLVAGAARQAQAAVPLTLTQDTIRIARGLIAGNTAAGLARGVLNSMMLNQLRVATALLFLGIGGTYWAWHAFASAVDEKDKTNPRPAIVGATGRVPATIPARISGRAADEQGSPIPGATISLFSRDRDGLGLNMVGQATTDKEGHYIITDAMLPVMTSFNGYPFPKEITPYAEFMLRGVTPGRGITWSPPKSIYALKEPNPDDIQERRVRLGDPVALDLTFPKAAALRGKIVDDEGNPLPGVELQVRSADLLDDAGRERNYPQGYNLSGILGPVGRAVTDREGRFRMDGLPDRACFFISARRPEAANATMNFYAATIDGPDTVHEEPPPGASNGRHRHEVRTGDLTIILPKLRPIAVTVVADDTGKPFPGIRIGTSTPVKAIASSGMTDGAGKTLLGLPPGRYGIYSDPPIETRYMRTVHPPLVVEHGQGAQPYVVRQKAGFELLIEAVEADTGKPVAGARFWKVPENQPEPREGPRPENQLEQLQVIQPSTFIVEDPWTDAKGKLRAVLPPEAGQRYRFRFAGIRGPNGGINLAEEYEAEPAESELIELAAGKTVRLRFALREPGQHDGR